MKIMCGSHTSFAESDDLIRFEEILYKKEMHLLLLAHTAKRYRIAAVNNDFWFLFGKDVIFTIYSNAGYPREIRSLSKKTRSGVHCSYIILQCVHQLLI